MRVSGGAARSRSGGVGVRKIKVRAWVDAIEQARCAGVAHLVPAHVRQLYMVGKRADLAWQRSQAAEFGRFLARFVESLEAQTHAEERNATCQCAQ